MNMLPKSNRQAGAVPTWGQRKRMVRCGAWLACVVLLQLEVRGQLAITEVMTASSNTFGTNLVTRGPDYWELTNFSTDPVDLTGYRFNDDTGGLTGAFADSFHGVVIQPNESVIFYESNAFSAADFRAWWELAETVQVIPYVDVGYGLSANGDSLSIWPPSAVEDVDVVDSVILGEATPGSSFTYDLITGLWGVNSIVGIGGAKRAATSNDIGSPGFHSGPVPCRIVDQPTNITVNLLDRVQFDVSYSGMPRPTLEWFHNGSPIPDARYSSYVMSNAEEVHAGTYQVVLSNSSQSVTSAPAVLTVSTAPSPPRFLQSPTDLWVFVDQTASFRAVATGVPHPFYQWRRNGTDLPFATNRSLEITASHEVGTNVYSIVVSNAHGAATNIARLLVFQRPDLRITELMAAQNDFTRGSHEDWWELTNFGTNAVDLFGYRFDDFTMTSSADPLPSLRHAWVNTNHIIIQPNESIVFVENMSAEEFHRWWGWSNLPASLQIVTYVGGGYSFSSNTSDGLALWNMGATSDGDVVSWPRSEFTFVSYSALEFPAAIGVSFTIDPEDPDDSCCSQFSQPGTNGAFLAAEGGDVGSPGYIRAPTEPRLLSVKRAESGWEIQWRSPLPGHYIVQWRETLSTGQWNELVTVQASSNLASYVDSTAPPGRSRFYRVVRQP